jgi:hypothetical protein
VILFSGALANMPRSWFAYLVSLTPRRPRPATGAA